MTPEIQNALNVIVKALGADASLPPIGPPVPVRWWVPTDTQVAALAKRFGWTLHDLYGSRQANGSDASPYVVACDGSDADAMLYASCGFSPIGQRWLWAADNREAAQSLCDKIFAAPTAAAANDIIRGAGDPGVTTDCACYLVMTGQTVGGGLAGTPRVGLGGATTVAEAVAVFFRLTTRKPGDPGAGIG